jgi:hypothetical protein
MGERVRPKSDGESQHDVLRELAWDPRVEQAGIVVEVRHSVVTLTGTVSSWGKRVAAEEAAYRVVGVLDVAKRHRGEGPGGLAAPTRRSPRPCATRSSGMSSSRTSGSGPP